MNHSESISKLAAALVAAQQEMTAASKDSKNPFFKSSYADLSSIWEAVKEPLGKNNLAITQTCVPFPADTTIVCVETILMHASGEWISGTITMKPVKQDPQGVGSCITYARRYGISAILNVMAEDDDGNEASKPAQKEPVPFAQEQFAEYTGSIADVTVNRAGNAFTIHCGKNDFVTQNRELATTAKTAMTAKSTVIITYRPHSMEAMKIDIA